VLIIGSGYRVRNSFLPALRLLDSDVEVVGVHSRNIAHAREAGEPFGVDAVENLRSLRPGDVDAVMVSVTPTSNLAVLRATAHLAPGAALVMDTPAAVRWGDLRQLALYRRWRTVRVAEDFMNLPQFRLVGKVIESGAVGDVVRIRLENMGYRYHALALLRSWLGFPLVRSAQCRWSRGGAVNIVYRFPGGVTGEVIEPFTGADGPFEVVGTQASISGHSMGHAIAGADGATARLERLEDNGTLSGFQVVGFRDEMTTSVPSLAPLRAMELEDDSEFNLLRVDALSHIISSLWSPDPLNSAYRLQDAMADGLVSVTSRALPWWPTPRRGDSNLVDLVESASLRAPSTSG
jgi:predicted dehydrogenase